MKDDSSAWALATVSENQKKPQAPGLGLAQLWVFWAIWGMNQRTEDVSPSLYVNLSFK